MSKVSVVIPTCNRPALLKRALRSVLAQTYQDFEIIVVDDGTESAANVAEDFKDQRIHYLKNEGVHGGSAARNRGIEAAQGEFIAFLDDDDEWLSEKLKYQVTVLEKNPEAVASFCGIRALDEKSGKFLFERAGRHGVMQPLAETLRRPFIWTSALMVRARDLRSEMFDELFPKNQEWDLEIRLLSRGPFVAVPEAFVVLHILPDDSHLGGVKHIKNVIHGTHLLLKKHAPLYAHHPVARAHVFERLGAQCISARAFTEARVAFREAWRIRPFDIRLLVKSFFPGDLNPGSTLSAYYQRARQRLFPRQSLFLRDVSAAHNTLSALYGSQHEAHRILDGFARSDFFRQEFSVGHSGDYDVMMLYTLARVEKPDRVVETGVASGRSSTAFLRALYENDSGHLYSIDLPHYHAPGTAPSLYTTEEGNRELEGFVPEGKTPGWLVPEQLRSRWTLILGDSKKELPTLLGELGAINLFYHDAEHTHEAMAREFDSAWPVIQEGGFLISDDTDWNIAWKEFITEKMPRYARVYRHFGIASK